MNIGRFQALGSVANIPRLLNELEIDEVVITLPWMYHRKIMGIVAQCKRQGVGVRIVPDIFQIPLNHLDVEYLGGVPMIGVREMTISGSQLLFKRTVDIVVSLIGLVLLFPLFAIIALAIRLDSPGPVFFMAGPGGERGASVHLFQVPLDAPGRGCRA